MGNADVDESIKQFNEKVRAKKTLNNLTKRWKEKRADRLIQATNPTLQTRDGIWDNLVYNAWINRGNGTEIENNLYELVNQKDLSTPQAKDLFKETLKSLDNETQFNLLHEKRLADVIKDEICKKVNKKDQEQCQYSFSYINAEALEKSNVDLDTNLKPILNYLKEKMH